MSESKPNLVSLHELVQATRAVSLWTPDRIRAAELMADMGDFTLMADLCDELRGDPKIQGALKTRVGALHGLPLSFQPGLGRRRGAAVKALEAQEDWWRCYPESELKEFQSAGIIQGVTFGQNGWRARQERPGVDDPNARLLPVLRNWALRSFRLDAKLGWVARAAKKPDGSDVQDVTVTAGDGTWIMYAPEGGNRPWKNGAWRALSRWWLLKQLAIVDWGNYSGIKGSGFLHGISPPTANAESNKAHRRALVADLQEIGKNAAIAPPPGYDIKLVESVSNTWQTFRAQIDVSDAQIVYCLHGTDMTSSEKGTYGKAVVLDGVRLQLIAADAESLSTCIHDGGLRWWAEFNFGDGALAPWPSWPTTPDEDLKAKGDSFTALGNGIKALKDAGIPVDTVALADEHNIPTTTTDVPDTVGQLFQYHFTFGIITINEARARLGLAPIKGGDVPPAPIAGAPPADAGGASAALDEHAQLLAYLGPGLGERPAPVQPMAGEAHPMPRAGKGAPGHAPTVRAGKAAKTPGHIAGQVYADAVADDARDRGADVLAENLLEVLAAIEEAETYADLRIALKKRLGDMTPAAMATVIERALLLAELGGRFSVTEDADA
jgi:phage gp29-like protein